MNLEGVEKSPKDYTEQNRLVLFTCVAGMTGFVVAVYLGAFAKTAVTEIPPWLSAVASVLATGISAIAVFLVARTLQATRETLAVTHNMAEDAKQVGVSQSRAWVSPDIVSTQTRVDPSEKVATFQVNLRVQNYGRSPATSVWTRAQVIYHKYGDGKLEETVSLSCVGLKDSLSFAPHSIFPGKMFEQSSILSFSEADLKIECERNDGSVCPILVVSAVYKCSHTGGLHQTVFAYLLGFPSPTHAGVLEQIYPRSEGWMPKDIHIGFLCHSMAD
ncbi:hypothetical protein [Leisingera sp. ANG59]|uniref:hypothetical protein n=1 Tax=Leisingera sp. ANG59 TaxID=2675221 RepID=UPI0015736EE0|nr:hypothetical protein [Leisingera sp. ANG59]NSY36859.1 hypothetical protein [Leisingera sp. ANG59]